MKRATLLTVLVPVSLLFASGCAGVQGSAPAKAAQQTARVAEPRVILPSDMGPPGSMDVSWSPTPPPPPKEIKPRRQDAKPHFVSDKRSRGRLFVLPTTYEH
jgi:hypothetical protein